jgi:hypothetical protein
MATKKADSVAKAQDKTEKTAVFNIGDRVRIVARAQTAADQKSGLYYPHFADLRGTILKTYGEEASVLVDRDALPDGIKQRHDDNEKSEHQRYLDRLSEEARNRLSPKEKEFNLQYAVLVSAADLKADDGTPPTKRVSGTDLDAAEEAFLQQRKSG